MKTKDEFQITPHDAETFKRIALRVKIMWFFLNKKDFINKA